MKHRSPVVLLAATMVAAALSFMACPNPIDPLPPAAIGSADDADLAAISLVEADLGLVTAPVASAPKALFGAPTRYYAIVRTGVASVTVNAAAAATDATVAGTGVHALGEPGTVTDITVTVTSRSGLASTEHVLSVRRAAADATNAAGMTAIWMIDASDRPSMDAMPGVGAKTLKKALKYTLELDAGSGNYCLAAGDTVSAGTVVSFGGTSDDPDAIVVGPGEQTLAAGANVCALKLVALDGSVKTYGIRIIAGPAVPSGDSATRLASLAVEGAALSPAFAPASYNYSCTVPAGSSSITVDLARAAAGADPAYDFAVGGATAASGTAAGGTFTVTGVPYGSSTLTVDAAPGSDSRRYVIFLFRPDPAGGSNAELSALAFTMSDGSTLPVPLSPAFDPAITSYSLAVPSYITHVELTAVPADSAAVVDQGDSDGPRYPSRYYYLDAGLNALSFAVRAADGSATKTYTVALTRRAAPTLGPIAASPSADGKTLNISGSVVDPNGEVDRVEVDCGRKVAATLAADGTFRAAIDLTALAAGKNGAMALAYHAATEDCLAGTTFAFEDQAPGAAAGHKVEVLVRNARGFEGTKYLVVMAGAYDATLDDVTGNYLAEAIPVTAADFPRVAATIMLPAGAYCINAFLCDAPSGILGDAELFGGVGTLFDPTVITLNDADLTGYELTLDFRGGK